MKTIYWMFLILMINFISCASTKMINREEDYNELNRKLEGKQVLIKLKNNEVITAEYAYISADSSSWFIPQGVQHHRFGPNNRQIIPTSEIREVSLKSTARGALRGLTFGLVTGLVGFYAFYSQGIDFGLSLYPRDVMIAVGAIGMVIGGVKGLTENYVINDPEDTIPTVPNP